MTSSDVQVLESAMRWSHHHTFYLCTVLSTFGSSPRPPGAMMIIRDDGQYRGSLSGGCIEESFIERVKNQLFTQDSQVVCYGQGGHIPDRELPCGGTVTILVEKLSPGLPTTQYMEKLLGAVTQSSPIVKTVIVPQPCQSVITTDEVNGQRVNIEGDKIAITVAAPLTVIIAGLSSVAAFCANFAIALGFITIVCEHREEALVNMAELLDKNVLLHREFPARYLEREGCNSMTAILSLTHDPRIDDLTMMEALMLPAFYIGAMGSERNSAQRKERLVRIGSFSHEQVNRIHAPVGLNIGSKTPSEIALSIMADIVRIKNGL